MGGHKEKLEPDPSNHVGPACASKVHRDHGAAGPSLRKVRPHGRLKTCNRLAYTRLEGSKPRIVWLKHAWKAHSNPFKLNAMLRFKGQKMYQQFTYA